MKVLLDENLAHRLRTNVGAHEVFIFNQKGWSGIKNVALSSVEWDILKHHLTLIVAAIDNALPGSFHVDCGTFTRKK